MRPKDKVLPYQTETGLRTWVEDERRWSDNSFGDMDITDGDIAAYYKTIANILLLTAVPGYAGEMMDHYLLGDGETLWFDPEIVLSYKDAPGYKHMIKQLRFAIMCAENTYKRGHPRCFTLSRIDPASDYIEKDVNGVRAPWRIYTSVGSYKLGFEARVRVAPGSVGLNPNPEFRMSFIPILWDLYAHKPGDSLLAAGIPTSGELNHLHRAGLAKQYVVWGVGDRRSLRWTFPVGNKIDRVIESATVLPRPPGWPEHLSDVSYLD